ncbi:MAG TPA: hypothetical protein VGM94_01690 [Galbitalea sp.]|jgi:hypothetical protein
MSAIRMGTGSGSVALADNAPSNPVLEFFGRWVKWIPAEVIAIYGATISQMQPAAGAASQTPVVSTPLWVIALVFTPVIVAVAGWLTKSTKVPLRVAFSIVAFVVWSSTVPHSAWDQFDLFTKNKELSYALLGLLSLVFPPLFDRAVGD